MFNDCKYNKIIYQPLINRQGALAMSLEKHIVLAQEINLEKIQSILESAYIPVAHIEKGEFILVDLSSTRIIIEVRQNEVKLQAMSLFENEDFDSLLKIFNEINREYKVLKSSIENSEDNITLNLSYDISFNHYFSIPDFIYNLNRFSAIRHSIMSDFWRDYKTRT